MRDYYDVYPLRALDKPLALTGFMGAGAQRVGNALSSRTGLPAIDLMRWVEHKAGSSVSELVLMKGEGALLSLEKELLDVALAERPAGIVILGDGTLLDDDNKRKVLAGATLIYLRAQLDSLFAAIGRDLEASPGCYPAFLTAPPSSASELLPLFHRRAPGYEAAEIVIDVDERSVTSVVEELKQRFAL